MAETANSSDIKKGLSFCVPEDQVALELASIVKFMRKDADHLVFRRFERLNLYNLLFLQRKLAAYDDQVSNYEREWNGPALAALLPGLEPLMKRYNEAFLLQTKMKKIKATSPHLASNLRAYAKQHLKPLMHELDPEMGWSELSSLSSIDKGLIHRFVERRPYLSVLFQGKRADTDTDSGLYTYSERGVLLAEQTIINLAFCALVLVPIFLLYSLSSRLSKLGKLFIILACVLLVAPIASALSNQAQRASLGVMAGYTAILVVFLSNNNSGTN